MAKSTVTVEISTEQEIALMDRFGRGCSRETLIDRAVAEAVTLQGKGVAWSKPEVKKRQAKAGPQASLLDAPPNGETLLCSCTGKKRDPACRIHGDGIQVGV